MDASVSTRSATMAPCVVCTALDGGTRVVAMVHGDGGNTRLCPRAFAFGGDTCDLC